jgi:DNA invertase Pin-like site-specific DNA recombinase
LAKALHLAKVAGPALVITQLDRLGRNVAFLLILRDSAVRFAMVYIQDAAT